MWAYNYFTTKIDNLTAEMTYTSKEMIDYLIKGVSGEFGRSRFTREFNTAKRPDQRRSRVSLPAGGGTPWQCPRGRRADVKSEPNVTPMIDVMLVLLIIFMIVTPADRRASRPTRRKGKNLKDHPEEDNGSGARDRRGWAGTTSTRAADPPTDGPIS